MVWEWSTIVVELLKTLKMKKSLSFCVLLLCTTIYAQVPSYVPTNGLVGYWPFNGNANDESGNGNNGVVNGATLAADRMGNPNSCYQLFTPAGSGGFIQLDQINLNDNFTITAWVTVESYTAGSVSTIISKYPANGSGYELDIDNETGVRGIYGIVGPENNVNNSVISNYSFDLNSWGHIVWSKEGPISKLYFNGILIHEQVNVNPTSTNNGPNFFGKSQWGGNQLRGKLDDVAVYNRALTQQEITNLFNANQCITNITVTDMLIINVGQLSFYDPVSWANNITIAPNPTSSQININFNNITNLNGGMLKIINSLGQQVATTPITFSGTSTTMSLTSWGGTGLYFVQILNAQGQILDIKKILLQ